MSTARLGLGLIGIGRPWPTPERDVPDEECVDALLHETISLGVTFFDTAPAYGLSERRLGGFLSSLGGAVRRRLTVATKCGEEWDADRGSRTDHSSHGIRNSVARSVSLIGAIDVLQLHQADVAAVQDKAILTTLREVQETHGIAALGASVKTPEACDAALEAGIFSYLQMPINSTVPQLLGWAAENRNSIVIIGNRPYASGQQVASKHACLELAAESVGPRGIVLTGTTNPHHLAETVAEWRGLG